MHKMAIKKEKLMIIDGNALIHRSFHALPPTMTTKKGEMVNAVYGFTAVLIKAIRELKPDFVVLTLDKRGATFRHEEYAEYKATRAKAPDELYAQIDLVKQVAGAFAIPVYEKAGFEADDLIGTLAGRVDGQVEKIIVTGDLDTLQLVNDHTKVYTMSRGLSESVVYDRKAVVERFGLTPEQMVDYKALRGDPSDNIPGVRGVGEKTACELLKEFKTLDGIYENLESKKIKDRIRELLREHRAEAEMSRRLATIDRGVELDFDLETARFGRFDQEQLVKLFSELEFKSLLPRLAELKAGAYELPPVPAAAAPAKERFKDKFERDSELFKYILINTEKKFASFLAELKRQPAFVFDTETSGFDPLEAELLGISFSWKKGEAYYIDLQEKKNKKIQGNLFEGEKTLDSRAGWIEKLKPIFEDEKIKKCGHNLKFDMKAVGSRNIDVRGIDFDTMVASYLLNPGSRQHNLDGLTFAEFGFEKISAEDLLGKGREKISFALVPLEKLYLYSCEDADFTFRLEQRLAEGLEENKLERLFKELEMPLVSVLDRMERNGIKVDLKFLKFIKQKTDARLKVLEARIKKEAGLDFNINSTQQLRRVLFEKLAIPIHGVGRTKTGLSTSAEELEKLKDAHPIIPLIQEYRELSKLASTYINALPGLINKKTGRLHTSFNQTVTATGRLSSTEPNLQNIPIRTEEGREIRKAFIADKGYKLVSLDYSQIELRLAAHMSGDEKMVKAFRDGADIHALTAAEINDVEPEEVTPEMRREAKAVNFGILYGQGPHGLSQGAGITYARAKEFIEEYFTSFSKVKKFIDDTIEQARERGFVETLLGRRRYLPEINSSVMQVRKEAERMAVNTPLQGTAADMIKAAMIKVAEITDHKVKMLLQVHDELVFEIEERSVGETVPKIKEIMENVLELKVPIEVDAKVGDNWGEMGRLGI